MLETRPLHRVAHLHVVREAGTQWRNYLAFRDLLRNDANARASYASTKRSLLAAFPSDRRPYQSGKEATVETLLRG